MYYLENICFLCLSARRNNTFYDSSALNIVEKLEYFIPKYLYQQSEVPKHICYNCSKNLSTFYKFKQNCLRSIAIFNEYVKKSSKENDTYRYLSIQLTDILHNKKSDTFNVNENNLENINKELKNEITEIDNYDQNQVVKLGQKNENIKQELTKEENVIENYEMKREITSELIIKEENFDDDILQLESESEQNKKFYGPVYQIRNDCESEDNNDFESKIDARNQIKNGSDKQFESNICSETFHSGDKLEIHNHIQISQNKFEYSHSPVRHESTHNDKNLHKCDICKKTFSQKCGLKRHKVILTGAKLYACDICNKTLNDVRHGSTNNDKKPYKCDVCKKAFCYKQNLVIHNRIHTGEKPFKCDICNKTFKQSAHLIGHKRIHTGEKPFTCDICNKTFKQSAHLNGHKLIHTDEKPFTCDVCNKTFKQKHNLNKHKRIHTGEKPFACDVCNKTFKHIFHFDRHKCIHTALGVSSSEDSKQAASS